MIPALPSTRETDPARVTKLLSDAILGLYVKVSELERRLSAVEKGSTRRASGSTTSLWNHFKYIELSNPTRLALYYTPDGITLQEPPLTEYIPEE